ncbi:type I-C CRISPR-associated protein Cas8c/Csd1 [Ruminococcus bovis]|uniref:Type I-C CRISPR-associated protein Cas8c/Csd1 n=1 Tax=Ruminococcus bovis TaxID=2564099 RepID=A0A4P8XTW0_9FIRM|nr:type I-C CRISPR-associated protein Cas8c/Csd1 [Ruminococcus bovis]QCT06445.1 type I-C CRISPR-associated protein Cas8c/Csd1 [Ruminococcus bovis]
MLLQSLVKLYEAWADKGEIEKLGWNPVKISYGISLDEDGNVDEIIHLKTNAPKGNKEIPSLISLPMPVKRSVGFLYDNVTYVFGYDNSNKPDRAKQCFDCFRNVGNKVLENTDDEFSSVIKKFLQKDYSEFENLSDLLTNLNCTENTIDDILNKGANLLLMPLGKFPTDSKAICESWNSYYEHSNAPKGICLVTGKDDHIAKLHPVIKGIRGAQAAGASLVSFNATAFDSYGKENGYNAPVSEYAAFAYTSALNKLVSDNDHRIFAGDTTVVCWTEDGESAYQDVFAGIFNSDDEVKQKDLHDTIVSIVNGNEVKWEGIPLNPSNNFYILGISPNSARLSVRFFIQNTFGKVMENLLKNQQRMEMVKPGFEKFDYIPLWRILGETVNKKSRDKKCKPHLAGDVLNSIINDYNYPSTLYYGILGRISAEQNINWVKASVLKAYLLKNYDSKYKEEITVDYNENSNNKAYLLGVLFSNLEEIQNTANPGIKSTIRDRYFTAASSTPSRVFPILIDLAQNHIKKISNVGAKVNCQKMLTETMSKLGDKFPNRLKLDEKGMFQLGYYQRTQERFTGKEDKE